jgi:hypothetical protein
VSNSPNSLLQGEWLAFSGDTDEETARNRFVERFEYEPEQVISVVKGRNVTVYVGPIVAQGVRKTMIKPKPKPTPPELEDLPLFGEWGAG